MNRDEMFTTARRELGHIPKGAFPQGLLRSNYWMMRLNSLGRKREYPDDPLQLIERAAADVHLFDPSATLEYDRDFFRKQSGRG